MKSTSRVIFVAVISFVLLFSLPAGEIAAAPAFTIKLAHNMSPGPTSAYDIWGNKFAELCKQYSNGKIAVTVYPGGQLGEDVNVAQQIQLGTIQMEIIAYNNLSRYYRPVQIFSLPFLFKSFDSAVKGIEGQVAKKIAGDFRGATGLRIIGTAPLGFRAITNSKRPILKPEDLNGIKLRVPPSPIFTDTFKALGASPVTIPSNELFSALQQKVVDGQEAVMTWAYTNGFAEVQKYLSVTNHGLTLSVMIVGDKYFEKMTPEMKKIMERSAAESTQVVAAFAKKDNQDVIGKFKAAKLQVDYPDTAPFQKKVQPVYEKNAKVVGGMDLIQKLIQETK